MTSAFDRIGDTLGAIGSGAAIGATGGVGGGQFAFRPDEIQALVKDWLDLAVSYRESALNAQNLASVSGPAEDSASELHATAASSSGHLYLQSLEEKLHYSIGQAQKCQDALNDYQGVDRQNVSDLLGTEPAPSGGI